MKHSNINRKTSESGPSPSISAHIKTRSPHTPFTKAESKPLSCTAKHTLSSRQNQKKTAYQQKEFQSTISKT